MPSPIAIIGAGVAGTAAAIFLRQQGFDVVLIERQQKDAAQPQLLVGESLPPAAKGLLEQLAVWDEFRRGPHLECYGNKSYWHSKQARYHDFVQDPVGHGWHIDRAVFETMLRSKARITGATLLANIRDLSVTRQQGLWNLEFKDGSGEQRTLQATFIIDATGRSSWFARRQGIQRLLEDQQFALTAFCVNQAAFEDTTSLVETTPQGWWYSAKLPGDCVAMALFCKPDKAQRELWLQAAEFRKLLAEAPHTSERFRKGKFALTAVPRFFPADSGMLEQMHGEGWLAVGDAAMTYDPIASHGLIMAMASARDAAAALAQYQQGVTGALQAYAAVLWVAYERYRAMRKSLYH
jgi:2-polyprenyl-6-methoxyphenol hydroxylase-like FAD-dependent oxidoreductase